MGDRIMMRTPFSLVLFASAALLWTIPAHAQDAAPTLDQAQTPAAQASAQPAIDDSDLAVDFDQSFRNIGNAYLSDSMRLNYQISLLDKMNERQAELLKISDSFAALGIPFKEPAPARGLCEQLPPNTPCLKHYPELYKPLINARETYYNSMRVQAAKAAGIEIPTDDPAAKERARKAKQEQERQLAEAKAKAEKLERLARYQWQDISCAAGRCTGVIVSQNSPGYRATVHVGSKLADGTIVEDIQKSGIGVVIAGDHINLRPAPGEEGSGSTGSGGSTQAAAKSAGLPASITPDTSSLGPSAMPEASAAAAAAASASASTDQGVVISNATPAATAGGDATTAAPAAIAANGTAAPTASGSVGDTQTSTVQPALGPSGLF